MNLQTNLSTPHERSLPPDALLAAGRAGDRRKMASSGITSNKSQEERRKAKERLDLFFFEQHFLNYSGNG